MLFFDSRSLIVVFAVETRVLERLRRLSESVRLRGAVALMLVAPVFKALTMSFALDVRSAMALGMSLEAVREFTDVSKAERELPTSVKAVWNVERSRSTTGAGAAAARPIKVNESRLETSMLCGDVGL